MARDKHEKERVEAKLPIVPVIKDSLDEPAWRAMSHGARSLYIALKRRISKGARNNGKVFLSQRQAAEEIGSHHDQICRWFRELEHYGWIVKMTAGHLGVDGKGMAPHWRLTELSYMKEPPTQDYRRWDGRKFPSKTESRAGNPARGVQEIRHTGVQEIRHGSADRCAGNPAHRESGGCAGNPAHTSITTGKALEPLFLLWALPMVRPEMAAALLALQASADREHRAAA